jgi:hypothetical protein
MGNTFCEIVAKPVGSFDLKKPEIRKQLLIENKNIAKILGKK